MLEVNGLVARNFGCDVQRVFGLRALCGWRLPVPSPRVRRPRNARYDPCSVRGTKQIQGQPVLDRRGPVRVRERPALIVRNRDEAGLRKLSNDVAQTRQVKPSVHGREKRHAQAAE